MDKLVKSQKGWLLIDSLIALVILSTAIVALISAYTAAIKTTNAATARAQATYLAQQAVETLKLQDGGKSFNATVVDGVLSPSNGITYTVKGTALPVAVTNLIPYQVTVSWLGLNLTMSGYCYVVP
jgi:Tfp pilus assembly protein PilV